jgi:hypothetical protein
MTTTPTIGRIVHYKLSASDAMAINHRRRDAKDKMDWHIALKTGAQVHVGNEASEGDIFPMIITRVWGKDADSAVNGQVFLDGNDLFWTTSVHCGDNPRDFAWPQRA